MKKFVHLGAFFGILVLVVLLTVGATGADPLFQEGEIEPDPGREGEVEPGREGEVEPGREGEVEAGEAAGADPSGTATRIDFEFTNDVAREGLYVVQETGGRTVASWNALDGWRDSGWINNLDISHEAVHVQVLYYPYAGAEPTVMRILNPVGGTEYGWLARGMEHALEVEFPDAAVVYGTVHQPVVVGVQTGGPLLVSSVIVAPAVPAQPASSAGEQVHVVQAGNNLFRIGLQYGCSYLELATYNGIPNPDLIFVGQTIRIPANCAG